MAWRWHCRRIPQRRFQATPSEPVLRLPSSGFTCRHLLRMPIVSVFLLYPARKEYADALAYEWHQRTRIQLVSGTCRPLSPRRALRLDLRNSQSRRSHTRRGKRTASGRAHEPHGSSAKPGRRVAKSLRGNLAELRLRQKRHRKRAPRRTAPSNRTRNSVRSGGGCGPASLERRRAGSRSWWARIHRVGGAAAHHASQRDLDRRGRAPGFPRTLQPSTAGILPSWST